MKHFLIVLCCLTLLGCGSTSSSTTSGAKLKAGEKELSFSFQTSKVHHKSITLMEKTRNICEIHLESKEYTELGKDDQGGSVGGPSLVLLVNLPDEVVASGKIDLAPALGKELKVLSQSADTMSDKMSYIVVEGPMPNGIQGGTLTFSKLEAAGDGKWNFDSTVSLETDGPSVEGTISGVLTSD